MKILFNKVFKNGPSKICRRQPLNNLKGYGLLKQTIYKSFFKGCLPQVSLDPFLNTLSYISYEYILVILNKKMIKILNLM